MEIVLATSKSEPNKADKIFDGNSLTLEGALRSDCSLTDPVIMFETDLDKIVKYNYMQIPDFNRKYFITEMVSVRTHLVRVTAHVDVLSTYIDRLRELPAVLESQESIYNLYLPDTGIKVIQTPEFNTIPFTRGGTSAVRLPPADVYSLVVAGGQISSTQQT